MTAFAEDERLTVTDNHDFRPVRECLASLLVEVGKFPHMVNFDLFRRTANFALICQEPFDEFRPPGSANGYVIFEDCIQLSSERESAKPCY